MLASLRALDPPIALRNILFYRVFYWIILIFFTLLYRARFYNTAAVPRSDGLLVIANHQSHLDPPLVGVALRCRNMAAIAREGLYKVWPLGWWLRSVGCIAIKDDEADAGAVRAAIAQLKRGRLVVIFPEGTRSVDGTIKEFKRGTWLLLARSGVPVLPAAVEGCFDAFPRGRALPRIFNQHVAVAFGNPIPFERLKALGPDAALALLRDQVESLRADLAQRLNSPPRRSV